MQISVETLAGSTISLELEPSDTIKDLKVRIQEEQGTPSPQQCLVLAGRQLEDTCALAELCEELEVESLQLVVRPGFRIFVKTFSNQTISRAVSRVSRSWRPREVINFSLEVVGSDTVDVLKSRVQEELGISAATAKRLMFSGRFLQSGHTLEEYGIQKESTVYTR
ncbi:unnamed protein product [Effrenium voratum]|nr:unnamed protein product [Effrenium voratum]